MGYAYRKAIQIIAYERKGGKKPSLPRSRSMRGAIQTWKRYLEGGGKPKTRESADIIRKEAIRQNLSKRRPFLRVEKNFFSGGYKNNFMDICKGVHTDDRKGGSPDLFFEDDKLEVLYSIADKLGTENDEKIWNREIRKYGLDVRAFFQYETDYDIIVGH